ncbi:kumamolisin [Nannocystis exedens]|uniref:Kumamolisin n=1 Tax=Nannocystis exedens TaxID=54 RepID=A0A1I2BUX6_9BACT|nr:S53 family peptidase [Nannocystis exedens]PCC71275.1 Pseudomonalisin precursor [Nannocystis exedens]SFE59110.1 kumamolisin [Nannocystis exedens]
MRLSLQLAAAADLGDLADAVSSPGDPRFGRHLDRPGLAARIAQPPAVHAAVAAWFAGADLRPVATGLADLTWHAELDRAQLTCLLGQAGAQQLLARRRLVDDAARLLVPPELASCLDALELGPWRVPAPPRLLVDPGVAPPSAPATGLRPAELARGYRFDRDVDGEGETIAVMALGGVPDAADVHGFARAFGLSPPLVELVELAPLAACAADPRFRFETTMGLQWLAAVAPRARLVVYFIDPTVAADPWGTFLEHVLSDMSRAPTIAVTSWSAPARQYYAVHGRRRFAGLLDRAAILGVTVIAASGDWGAYDGFPSSGPARDACDALVPRDTFPGCEARVLSVGGTQVVAHEPWREVAWSAPVSSALREAIGLPALAGSGGVSVHVPVPAYQRGVLPREISRGPAGAPVPAAGRVQPDVALMAWGPDAGERPTAYACLLDGEFRDDAGGTSLAAPIWAGIVARLNRRRRARGLARLGQLQPRLYAACARDPALLRDIVDGDTDLELPLLADDSTRRWQLLPGFRAAPGFDPATGLGVPNVEHLAAKLGSSDDLGPYLCPRGHVLEVILQNPSDAPEEHVQLAALGS